MDSNTSQLNKSRLIEEQLLLVQSRKATVKAKLQELASLEAKLSNQLQGLRRKVNKALLVRQPLFQRQDNLEPKEPRNTPKLSTPLVSIIPSLQSEHHNLLDQYELAVKRSAGLLREIEEAKAACQQLKCNIALLRQRSSFLEKSLSQKQMPLQMPESGLIQIQSKLLFTRQNLDKMQQVFKFNHRIIGFNLLHGLQSKLTLVALQSFFNLCREKQPRGVSLSIKLLLQNNLNRLQHLKRKWFSRWRSGTSNKSLKFKQLASAIEYRADLRLCMRVFTALRSELQTKRLSNIKQRESDEKICSLIELKVVQKRRAALLHWRGKVQSDSTQNRLKRLVKMYNKKCIQSSFIQWRKVSQSIKKVVSRQVVQQERERICSLVKYFRRWKEAEVHEVNSVIRKLVSYKDKTNKVVSYFRFVKRRARFVMSVYSKLQRIRKLHYFARFYQKSTFLACVKLKASINLANYQNRQSQKREKQFQTNCQNAKLTLLQSIANRVILKLTALPRLKHWRRISGYLLCRQNQLRAIIHRKVMKQKVVVLSRFAQNVRSDQKSKMHKILTQINKDIELMKEKSDKYRESLAEQIKMLGNKASRSLAIFIDRKENQLRRQFFNIACISLRKRNSRFGVIKGFSFIYRLYLMRIAFKIIKVVFQQQKQDQRVDWLIDRKRQLNQAKLKRGYFGKMARRHKRIKTSLRLFQTLDNRLFQTTSIIFFTNLTNYILKLDKKQFNKQLKGLNQQMKEKGLLNSNLLKSKQAQQQKCLRFKNAFLKIQNLAIANRRARKQRVRAKLMLTFWKKLKDRTAIRQLRLGILHNLTLDLVMSSAFSKIKLEFKSKRNAGLFQEDKQAQRKLQAQYEKVIKIQKEASTRLSSNQQRYTKAKDKHARRKTRIDKYSSVQADLLRKKHDQLRLVKVFNHWKTFISHMKLFARRLNQSLSEDSVYYAFKLIKQLNIRANRNVMWCKRIQKIGRFMIRSLNFHALVLWRINSRVVIIRKQQQSIRELTLQHKKEVAESKRLAQVMIESRRKVKQQDLKLKCYLIFKRYSTKRAIKNRKIRGHRAKISSRFKRDVFTAFACLVLRIKKCQNLSMQFRAKRERVKLSNCLKRMKEICYNQTQGLKRLDSLSDEVVTQQLRHAFSKILIQHVRKQGRQQLNKNLLLFRALRQLDSRLTMRKLTFFRRWHNEKELDDRRLVIVLHRLVLSRVKSHFQSVNRSRFWNDQYILKVADQQLNDKKKDIKKEIDVFSLENIDSEEVKSFVAEEVQRNERLQIRVIKRLAVYGGKRAMLKAWNSWLEFRDLRKEMRQRLKSLFNGLTPKGRYFLRWKSGDKNHSEFKQKISSYSRAELMESYEEMVELQKGMARSTKLNQQKLQQLVQLTEQLSYSQEQAVYSALKFMSRSVKKGMEAAILIWRRRAQTLRSTARNAAFEQLASSLGRLGTRKAELLRRVQSVRDQNLAIRQNCLQGKEVGRMLELLMVQRDRLSVNLADSKLAIKRLLEDNVRLRGQLSSAKSQTLQLLQTIAR